jgi:virginiamycin B lyase
MMRRLFVLAVVVLVVGCSSRTTALQPPTYISPQVVQKQPLPAPSWTWAYVKGHGDLGITALASDGHDKMWFTENYADAIGSMDMGQRSASYPVGFRPGGLTVGPDQNIWVTSIGSGASGQDYVARVTPYGSVTTYTVSPVNNESFSIATGPDGALWFPEMKEEVGTPDLGRLTTNGAYSQFPLSSDGWPTAIVAGPDGNLWIADGFNIEKVTTDGIVTVYRENSGQTVDIAVGSDGALWYPTFGGNNGNALGRMTTEGASESFPTPNGILLGNTGGHVITNGPDGRLWMRTGQDLITFDPATLTWGPLIGGFNKYGVSGIAVGPDENIWTGVGNRLATFVRLAMTVQPSRLTIPAPGQTGTLTVTETNYAKRWSATSTNPAVATVPSGGTRKPIVVTAVGVGSCTIVISDRFYNRVRIKVTVQ